MVALSPKYLGRSAAEETINDPTNPRHYWRYRTHYTLEDLLADEPLLADLQALLLGTAVQPFHSHASIPNSLTCWHLRVIRYFVLDVLA